MISERRKKNTYSIPGRIFLCIAKSVDDDSRPPGPRAFFYSHLCKSIFMYNIDIIKMKVDFCCGRVYCDGFMLWHKNWVNRNVLSPSVAIAYMKAFRVVQKMGLYMEQ